MDYTRLMSNGRYKVECIYNCVRAIVIDFIVDTGSVNTIIDASVLGLAGMIKTGKSRKFRTASNEIVKFDEIVVKQFTVASVDLGECKLYLGEQNLLGMDLLSKVTFIQNANSGKLIIKDGLEQVHNNEFYLKKFCDENNVNEAELIKVLNRDWRNLPQAELYVDMTEGVHKIGSNPIDRALKFMNPCE